MSSRFIAGPSAAHGGVATRSSSTSSRERHQHDEEVAALLAELEDLKKENDCLRQVQDQFWQLLYEKEDLQRELEVLRTSQRQLATSVHGADGGQYCSQLRQPANKGGHNSGVEQREYDAVSTALHECMELLMDKEQQQTLHRTELGSRGPVRAFLSWLALSHDRAQALTSLQVARDEAGIPGSLSPRNSKAIGVFSPTYGVGSISKEEKESLLRELHLSKQEVRQLQEELDRTDMSRMQALEDAERMQQQIEVLSSGVQDLRKAYNGVKQQAESSMKNSQAVQDLKSQLANRDATIHELKAKLSQQQRLSSVGSTTDLAADAARIRRQLAQRSDSQGSNAQNIMLSP
jgi:predicted RNase H-like nuclease (RuvC/YqgF family)